MIQKTKIESSKI